jgi:hypothetical protein
MMMPAAMAYAMPNAMAMVPEHGGSVAMSGAITTEVVTLPDGRVAAFVRDSNRMPVLPSDVQMAFLRTDGSQLPVPLNYDPTVAGYVGSPMGVVPGSYPVVLNVRIQPFVPPVQLVTPPIVVIRSFDPPPVYYAPTPRPVYYRRSPVYARRPMYVQPRYYAPAPRPMYVGRPTVYVGGGGIGFHRGFMR